MAQWAFPLEAGCAVQRRLVAGAVFQPHDGCLVVEWWGVQGAAGAKNGNLRHAEGSRHMHQARVVADYFLSLGNGAESQRQRRLARKIQALPVVDRIGWPGNRLAQVKFFG